MGEIKEKIKKEGRKGRKEGKNEAAPIHHYNTHREKENLAHFQKLGTWSINIGVLENDSTFLKSKS